MNESEAVGRLAAGGVVALPTETVYGLAADASNEAAVRRVFEIKGRPSTNPLIVHVADAEAARRVTATWPDAADRLAKAFWPGPLTIVLPKGPSVSAIVTAGGPTVALRVPRHELTLEVLRGLHASGIIGLAMPSANKSEHVSPTTADHVRDEFGDSVHVLDGGPCDVGIESTVVSLAQDTPTVLRPGHVTHQQLAAVLGDVQVRGGSDSGSAQSPGRLPRHYAPTLPCIRFERGETPLSNAFVIGTCEQADLRMPDEPAQCARRLYDALRTAEQSGASVIAIELPPDEPSWSGVRDRIERASTASHPSPV